MTSPYNTNLFGFSPVGRRGGDGNVQDLNELQLKEISAYVDTSTTMASCSRTSRCGCPRIQGGARQTGLGDFGALRPTSSIRSDPDIYHEQATKKSSHRRRPCRANVEPVTAETVLKLGAPPARFKNSKPSRAAGVAINRHWQGHPAFRLHARKRHLRGHPVHGRGRVVHRRCHAGRGLCHPEPARDARHRHHARTIPTTTTASSFSARRYKLDDQIES